jgi:hypothetical protein
MLVSSGGVSTSCDVTSLLPTYLFLVPRQGSRECAADEMIVNRFFHVFCLVVTSSDARRLPLAHPRYMSALIEALLCAGQGGLVM